MNQISIRMEGLSPEMLWFQASPSIKLHIEVFICKYKDGKLYKKTRRRICLQFVVIALSLLDCGILAMICLIWNCYSWSHLSFISLSLQSVPIPNVTSGGLLFETKLFLESTQFSNPNYFGWAVCSLHCFFLLERVVGKACWCYYKNTYKHLTV